MSIGLPQGTAARCFSCDRPVRALVAWALASMLLGGCATPKLENPSGAGGDLRVSFAPANAQPGRREPGIFTFEHPEVIRVKVRRLPLLAFVDQVAYRRGINYRVSSDLTPFQVDVSGKVSAPLPGEEATTSTEWERTEQAEFRSDRQLLDHVVAQVNEAAQLKGRPARLHYSWQADGPEFYLTPANDNTRLMCNERDESPPRCDPAQINFKKFFVRNVHVDEAVRSVNGLFFKSNGPGQHEEAAINKANVAASTLAVYRPQNAFVVRSTDPSVLDKVSQALFALDASYQQVLIETMIFQYDESTARRIGSALSYKKEDKSADGTRSVTSAIETTFGSLIGAHLPKLFVNFSDTEKRATLLAKLALYDSDGYVRVLAEPRLVLQSGEEASVLLNTKKHVVTSGVNTSTITPITTGITLKLTPTVLGNGKVRIKVNLEQSEFVSTSETGVVLTEVANKVDTSIVTQDGEMVSIGGIHSRRDGRSGSGLPGLRDVPGLGVLFGDTAGDHSRSRIEFMIRPTVERAPQRLRAIQGNIEKANLVIERDITSHEGGPSKERE